jgi:hypothetical protein
MPVLARNIRRQRGEQTEPNLELGSMCTAMLAQLGEIPKPETYRTDIEWEELTPRDDSEAATILEQSINAMLAGVDGGLISLEAAIDFLGEFVPTLLPASTEGSQDDERARIAAGKTFLDRLESGSFDRPPPPPRLRPAPEPEPANAGAGA